MQTIKIKTYKCSCGYTQDFNPNDADLMALHFPGVEVGKCPACSMGKNPERETKSSDLERVTSGRSKMIIYEAGDDIEVPDLDGNGKVKKDLITGEEKTKVRKAKKGEYLEPDEIQILKDKYEDN